MGLSDENYGGGTGSSAGAWGAISVSIELTSLRPQNRLSPTEELAKSMLVLANGHARMAASLGTMGVKWNMGKVDSSGWMVSKDSSAISSNSSGHGGDKASIDDATSSAGKVVDCEPGSDATTAALGRATTTTTASPTGTTGIAQHERLRMAVRGALDTANHEEDITNSTFLNRSTVLNAVNNKSGASPVSANAETKAIGGDTNRISGEGHGGKVAGSGDGGVNPVDDL